MIQAFGLTSNPRKELPPAVDDVSFEARAGRVTALLGASGAGKTTALRLMLELERGRGITYFRGRPLHRVAHPSREVGVLLGDVPGHPARTVRGHLRMLCAAAGVPGRRADEVLEVVGLVSLRDEALGTLSRGMDRRLGLACALLADPHTLVLDDPAGALSVREARWLHGTLRAYAAQGGTVLFSTADPKEAARTADHVVTLERGRVVADQGAADFSRTRLRPRVAVRSPHAARLAATLTKEARTARRSVEVVREGGNRLAVYGSTCADVGETAFRNGILVHQLADEVGDMGPGAGAAHTGRHRASEAAAALGPTRQSAIALPSPAEPPEQAAAASQSADAKQTPADDGGPVPHGSLPQGPAPQGAQRPTAAARPSPAEPEPHHQGQEPADDHPRSPADEPRSPADRDLPETMTHPLLADRAEPSTGSSRPSPLTEQASPAEWPPSMTAEPQGLSEKPEGASAEPQNLADARQSSVKHPRLPADAPQPAADETPISPAAPARPLATPLLDDPRPSAAATGPRRAPNPRYARSPAEATSSGALPSLPPPISVRSAPSPLRPLRYELRRAAGIGTGFVTGAAVLFVSAVTAVLLARIGHTPQPRLLVAWPRELPLPPAALGAGLLGALAFGDEFRHPALAADRGTVPRRLGLLTAKLLVSAATAVALAVLTVGCDAEMLYLFYGGEVARFPSDWLSLSAGWIGLLVGCAWAGVLAAGVFRSTTAGLAAVVAVPVLVVPLVQRVWEGPSVRTAAGLPLRLREVFLTQWPFGGERYLAGVLRVIGQPVGSALTLSLTALLCAYLFTNLRSRVR
ncbi:ATP-binding cassette domain-containing protein [Streptomyces viridiviolaceus]